MLVKKTVVCFSHGQESGPWGTKIKVLAGVARDAGWPVESLDYQGIPEARERVRLLLDWCRRQPVPPFLVGSSMGAFVALAAAVETAAAGLFLLAPALLVPGYRESLPAATPGCPMTIVHGWHDEVIPWEHSVQYASAHQGRLLLLPGDHRLTANLPEISALFRQCLAERAAAVP